MGIAEDNRRGMKIRNPREKKEKERGQRGVEEKVTIILTIVINKNVGRQEEN